MSTEMKTGLVLSGGGAVGAYQAGVVKALAECGSQISMVSGASIGAFNGAIIAASPDLSEAAVRLEALWDHLGNNQVLSVNRSVYFSLLKKLFQAMTLCQIPGRAGALLTTLLRHISIPCTVTPCFGARLVQEGNQLHYLADRAGIRGRFSDADAYHLDQAFPLLMKQLELMLTSGELNPRHQHTVTLYAKGLTCKADTLGSCGYVYLAVYPTSETKK
ncbi:hypothetical protein FCX55_01875 [Escherichia coli]|nr:hypothetical protein [Escherichia coli]